MPEVETKKTDPRPDAQIDILKPPLLDRRGFHIAALLAGSVLIALAITSIKFTPDLSHVDIAISSGSTNGNYYAVVNRMAARAEVRQGKVTNIASKGSIDNIERLLKAADGPCDLSFALVQDGLDWGDSGKLNLIARLTTTEVVFFLGPDADDVQSFADLDQTRIGIGPPGSGTARAAEEIFSARGFDGIDIQTVKLPLADQLAKLKKGELDLGVFVIAPDATMIDDAIRNQGMQIAHFPQAPALAHQTPMFRAGTISAGHYDPVGVLPATDKSVLMVDTLIIGNGCASHSDIVGLLVLLNDTFPGIIDHNTTTPNGSGLAYAADAMGFFTDRGPAILDDYVPWLADFVPLGSIVQLVMVISILFNIMGGGNRFRLWRIDANRVNLELILPDIFGPEAIIQEIASLEPTSDHRSEGKIRRLDALIHELEALKDKTRKYSLSMLVPMGGEMGYRYQEGLITERIAALRKFRERLA